MPYIIDGHNLIGQLPTISLADPDDEAKLVQLLQRYAMRHRVSMTVFFDNGSYGQSDLGGAGVSVVFARSPEDADRRIVRHMQKLSQPQGWTLVSADTTLTGAAQAAGLRVIDARDFAARLLQLDQPSPGAAQRAAEQAEAQAQVKGGQLDQWFELFGVSPEEASRPVDLYTRPKKQRDAASRQERRQQAEAPPGPTRSSKPKQGKRDRRGRELLKPPPPAHPDEVEEWMRFFNVEDDE